MREDKQTLIFGTRVLKNNNTLESYGVKAGSELFLVDISQEEIVNITAKNVANESEMTYTSQYTCFEKMTLQQCRDELAGKFDSNLDVEGFVILNIFGHDVKHVMLT